MDLTDEEVGEIAERHAGASDGGQHNWVLGRWFRAAFEATRETGGWAALEIGVREGGTSAMLCEMADRIGRDGFLVFSVDPYGDMPYYTPRLGTVYGERTAVAAKTLLAPFARSVVLRMPALEFINQVLPWYRWWWGGAEYPPSRRFLSFAFVDGQHENTNVVQEVAGLAPFMASGGVIAVDNTEHCPEAMDLLAASPRLALRDRVRWTTEDGGLRREAFTVP